jgi:hypothetical protein
MSMFVADPHDQRRGWTLQVPPCRGNLAQKGCCLFFPKTLLRGGHSHSQFCTAYHFLTGIVVHEKPIRIIFDKSFPAMRVSMMFLPLSPPGSRTATLDTFTSGEKL